MLQTLFDRLGFQSSQPVDVKETPELPEEDANWKFVQWDPKSPVYDLLVLVGFQPNFPSAERRELFNQIKSLSMAETSLLVKRVIKMEWSEDLRNLEPNADSDEETEKGFINDVRTILSHPFKFESEVHRGYLKFAHKALVVTNDENLNVLRRILRNVQDDVGLLQTIANKIHPMTTLGDIQSYIATLEHSLTEAQKKKMSFHDIKGLVNEPLDAFKELKCVYPRTTPLQAAKVLLVLAALSSLEESETS